MSLIKVDTSKKPRELELHEMRREVPYDPRKVFGDAYDPDHERVRIRYWGRAYRNLCDHEMSEERRKRGSHANPIAARGRAQMRIERLMNEERESFRRKTGKDLDERRDDTIEA